MEDYPSRHAARILWATCAALLGHPAKLCSVLQPPSLLVWLCLHPNLLSCLSPPSPLPLSWLFFCAERPLPPPPPPSSRNSKGSTPPVALIVGAAVGALLLLVALALAALFFLKRLRSSASQVLGEWGNGGVTCTPAAPAAAAPPAPAPEAATPPATDVCPSAPVRASHYLLLHLPAASHLWLPTTLRLVT